MRMTTLIQDQVTLSWDAGEVPDVGETKTIRGYVTPTTQLSTSVRSSKFAQSTRTQMITSITRPPTGA